MKKRIAKSLCVISLMLAFTGNVFAASPGYVYPVGRVTGICAEVDGVLVEELREEDSPAAEAGIKKGDRIVSVNGRPVENCENVRKLLSEDEDGIIELSVCRGDKKVEISVQMNQNSELGVWLKDCIYGLGTITYYTDDGVFGALGHPITEGKIGLPLPVSGGTMMRAELTGIEKGQSGTPGQLRGSFSENGVWGTLLTNSYAGIFGTREGEISEKPVEICPKTLVHTGKAELLSDVAGGEPKAYEVEITRIVDGGNCCGREFSLTVTDPELISLTGGIVQGMSGSPLLQDGKMIGAVTHVLIDEPMKGYGIGIETMLREAEASMKANAA